MKGKSMDNTIVDKPFWQSKTIWGNAIAVLGVLLGMFGYQLAPDASQALLQAIGDLIAAGGSAYSVYGRFRAGGIYIKAPAA
jgi:hypothetical protein